MAAKHVHSSESRSHLKAELEKEEVLLKSTKDKLINQLQRLKVEELALMKYLSLLNNPTTTTATYFSQQQVSPSAVNERDDEVNNVPLSGLTENLASNPFMLNTHGRGVEEEEEEEEEVDED